MHKVEANGASIPAIGMGTWTLRGADCARLVAQALTAGYRHIDTAAMYGNEEAVGEGIRASGVPRADIFVTTKVWHTDLRAGDLRRSAEASLKRLGLDEVDLLLIHWPNPAVPLSESIGALNGVRDEGLSRHIGVSNFPSKMLKNAIALSEAPLVCNQVECHPYLAQTMIEAVLGKSGMALVAFCPIYRGGDLLKEAAVAAAAARLGKAPAQIVLRWHMQQKGHIAIPRTSRAERLQENLAVFDFALTDAEMAAISALKTGNRRLCNYDFSPQWDRPEAA